MISQLQQKKLDNTFEYWERLASDSMLDDQCTLGGKNPHGDRFVDVEHLEQMQIPVDHTRARVLDAGAGYGRFAIPIAKKCELVVAVDLSLSMIGRLKRNAKVHGVKGQIDVIRADIRRLPFRHGCLDGIVCSATFYYLPKQHWYDALQSFSDMLRTDGWLLVTFKDVRTAFRLRFGFGLLYLAAYVVLKSESRSSLLRSLSRRFGLHGRTEYLVTKRRATKLLSIFFTQVVSTGSPTSTYICKGPHIRMERGSD